MKKLNIISLLVLMFVGMGQMYAEESVAYTLTPAEGSNQAYASYCDVTIDDIVWNLTGNSKMIPWRIGGKSLTGVDRALYSKTAIGESITKIVLTHSATIEKNRATVNSMKVIVASDAQFSNVISELTPTFDFDNAITITRPDGATWENAYYKFVYNITVEGDKNKFIEFEKGEFYYNAEGVIAKPQFETEQTEFFNAMDVELSAEEGLKIYYTLDGTNPTKESTLYTGAINITATTTIMAIAYDETKDKASVIVSMSFTKLTVMSIEDANKAEKDAKVVVEGVVVAVSTSGAIIGDDTEIIYLYNNNHGLAIGDKVRVNGAVTVYKNNNQFTSTAVITKLGKEEVSYPTAVEWDGAAMEAWTTAPTHKYVTVEGVLTISDGKYYNIAVDDTDVLCSILAPVNDISNLNGKTIVVTGYAIYVSTSTSTGDTYAYIASTSVEEKGGATAIEEVNVSNKARKVVENGVIYIYRNGVRYNALGAEVK